jgi:RHS repeat-associated protein
MNFTFWPNHLLTKTVLIFTLVVLGAFDCLGQAARPDRGVMPTSSYAISDIENINLTNGNLNLSIPLASLPPIAGSKLGFTLRAEYNSKGWDTVREELISDPLNPVTKYVVTHLQQSGGWRVGGAYQVSFEDVTWDYQWRQPAQTDPEYNLLTQNRWSKVMLVTPDGATHELRPVDYSPYADGFLNHNYLRGYYKDDPNTVGTALRYYSYDGSHLWAKIDPSAFLYSGVAPSWTIYLPNGTHIEQANGIQRIVDTNGNKVKIWTDGSGPVLTTHYQDEQSGREIKYVYDSAGNGGQGSGQIQYQAVGGTWMTTTVNFGTAHVFGKVHAFNDPDCGDSSVYIDNTTPVVRSIVFPQTEPAQAAPQLTFSYNSDTTDTVNFQWRPNCAVAYQTITTASHGWGSLSRVVLTSGAVLDYEYSLDGQTYPLFDPDDAPRESLTGKTITHDGISESWAYSVGPAGSSASSPDGSVVSETRYPSDPAFSHNYSGFGGKEGLVYRTNTSNRTVVERHWSLMIFSGGNNIAPGASVLVGFNPVVDAEYTSLLDDTPAHNPVKMSARTFQYDYNGNLLTQTDYDWFDPALVSRDSQGVPMAVPASATALRVTNNTYYNPASSASSSNVYAKRSIATGAPLILNAVQQGTVGPGIVQLSYDGQGYGVAPTTGNLTTKKVWVDLDSRWITTSITYGPYGNVATTTDGRGKVTQYSFADATHALPTSITVDPQNGTGAQTSSTAYDYYTGLVTSQTDVNGQVSTIDYTNQLLGTVDPFGRPGIVKAPQINISGTNHRQRVTSSYIDSGRQVIVARDVNTENDKLLKTRTTADQLGRTVLTEQSEDGTNYTISIVNKFLDMGRVTLTSSARRSTASTTDSWTRITKDSEGRIIEVTTFGGATQPAWTGWSGVFTGAVTTAYDANFTTVTDQAGKVRRSMMDGLGRLRRVDEPDTNGNLGSTASPVQPSSYSYDVFGNLTAVTQGSQTRTFTYDSLSRLRTATNPESGTVTYQYDDNGNAVVKTDARSVSAHFEYDSLNRVTRRWYNGSNSVNSTNHNNPALPSGVGATNEAKFYYDTQSLPAGAPSYMRGSAIGRLVAQTSGSGSNGDYFAYDVLGRSTLKVQQTGTVNYQLTAAYNLTGAMTTLMYPSGHTVSRTYDQAARLAAISGNLGDGSTRIYATGILYSPTGGLVKEQLGTTTPVYNKLFYNSRGQLAEIRASTSYTGPTDYDANRGAIINSYSSQCIGLCSGSSMSDNNGNLKQQDIQIPSASTRSQYYEYDKLNRLKSAREVISAVEQWKQQFIYDRWGNRLLDNAVTYGTGINKVFTVNTANNRLGVPAGQSGTMTYDTAGNLTNDSYTGVGNRTYDAENKITSAWGGNNQAQFYSYDASGQRIQRRVNGVETWQVYGFGGEVVAEYAANDLPSTPQKEYCYREGQLLITANAASLTNFALNKTATQSSTAWSGPASRAVDGNTDGVWNNNSVTHTDNDFHGWWQVDLGQVQSITAIRVWNRAEFLERLTSFYVFVSDNPFTSIDLTGTQNQVGVSSYYTSGQCGFPTDLAINRTGRYVRVQLAGTNYLSMAEVQILGTTGPSLSSIQWLISDQLGTPRMVIDQTANLNTMKRHDYLPFGEELVAPTGGRTAVQGYVGGDGVRQQFTSQERDVEISLDYFGARYYSSLQGRFVGVDPGRLTAADPQNFNRYSYVQNNPLKFIDPTGRELTFTGADADYIVAELSSLTGYTLDRNPITGKVTIDKSKKRKITKKTSLSFANKVATIIGDPRVHVKIETARNAPGVTVDSYRQTKIDVADYDAFKRADWTFAAAALAHVIAEYYHEQLIPFAGTASTYEVPGGGARGATTREQRFEESHEEGLYFESQVLGDLRNWWEQPAARTETKLADSTMVHVEYSTVSYDVFIKNNTITGINKHERQKPRN